MPFTQLSCCIISFNIIKKQLVSLSVVPSCLIYMFKKVHLKVSRQELFFLTKSWIAEKLSSFYPLLYLHLLLWSVQCVFYVFFRVNNSQTWFLSNFFDPEVPYLPIIVVISLSSSFYRYENLFLHALNLGIGKRIGERVQNCSPPFFSYNLFMLSRDSIEWKSHSNTYPNYVMHVPVVGCIY